MSLFLETPQLSIIISMAPSPIITFLIVLNTVVSHVLGQVKKHGSENVYPEGVGVLSKHILCEFAFLMS